MITLEQLLQSREERAALQQSFLREYPDGTLLCLTVQLPGPEKRNELSLVIADAAVKAVRELFPARIAEELRDLETGFEGYFVVQLEPLDAKHAVCGIEDQHPLGRLMDIDVVTEEGPLSRAAIGLPERKCLLCDRPARECMRARRHTLDELLRAIEDIVLRQQNQ